MVGGCTFANNQAIGGSNNLGSFSGFGFVGNGNGGAIYQGGTATVTNSTFIGNQARGGDRNTGTGSGTIMAGAGLGGAIFNPFFDICVVNLSVGSCAFTNNRALGGTGNSGGVFAGAGIGGVLLNFQAATATVANSTLKENQAIGGVGSAGGNGGSGLGGGLANLFGSNLAVRNCTITRNVASGGAAGTGGGAGLGVGGGAYFAADSVACLDALTRIFANAASTSNNDIFGAFETCP